MNKVKNRPSRIAPDEFEPDHMAELERRLAEPIVGEGVEPDVRPSKRIKLGRKTLFRKQAPYKYGNASWRNFGDKARNRK